MGFELTVPAFERTKSVRALDGAATAIGLMKRTDYEIPHDVTISEKLLLLS
jgi:hypothetical protein